MVFRPTRGDGPARHGAGVQHVPDIGPSNIPADWYTDPARFELERTLIFRRSWLVVGRVDELPAPGDHLVWEGHGETIVITRRIDATDQPCFSAFHNVCQHRGTRLVQPAPDFARVAGGARRYACNWHGWVYDTNGVVVGIPDRDDFGDSQVAGLCAPPVAVDTWGGWLWVYLDPHDQMPTLTEWLGPDVANDLGRYEMERMRVHAKETIELDVNWKVVVDGFNEMYHIDALHHVRPQDVKDGRESSFFVFGRNSMMIVPLGTALHELSQTGDHLSSAICHYVVFPNSVFNNGPLDLQLFHPVPLSATRTRFECWNLVYDHERGGADSEYDAQVDRHWQGLRHIVSQDVFIFAEVNATRSSLGYTENRFNARECKPSAFHHHIDDIINERDTP